MTTFETILSLTFALGVFVPLVIGLVACMIGLFVLPFVLVASR